LADSPLLFPTVREVLKSVNSWWSYCKTVRRQVFWNTVYTMRLETARHYAAQHQSNRYLQQTTDVEKRAIIISQTRRNCQRVPHPKTAIENDPSPTLFLPKGNTCKMCLMTVVVLEW